MKSKIIQGDCLDVLRTLKDDSIDCCVTSPPYWGLRDYAHDDQVGLETTPEKYVETMVRIFREVRRVMSPTGTLWLNLGDSYAQGGSGGCSEVSTLNGGFRKLRMMQAKSLARKAPAGLKPKDLVGIPWRVAFALQADGWTLRQDIIWQKPNVMPESVSDRCTKSHEYIFLMTKSRKYFFDAAAIEEDAKWDKWGDSTDRKHQQGMASHLKKLKSDLPIRDKRNKRSVWSINTRPYKGDHFAAFPPALVEPCILAGCPRDGMVLDPFLGSGTTALVALKHGRRYVGIELNPEYVNLAKKRIEMRDMSRIGTDRALVAAALKMNPLFAR